MATSGEWRIVAFLAFLALTGGAVRSLGVDRFEGAVVGTSAPTVRGAARALAAQRAAVDSATLAVASRRSGLRKATARRSPKAATPDSIAGSPASQQRGASRFPIDVNTASPRDLERLPRVGSAMAGRIIEYREKHGPFQSLEALGKVRGIGPATLKLLEPLVTFSSWHRPLQSRESIPFQYEKY